MERGALARDRGLSFRMAACVGLLAALYLPILGWIVAFAWLATGSAIRAGLVGAGAVAFVAAAPYLSELLALSVSGARAPRGATADRLVPLVERVAAMADIPPPRVAVMSTDVPNAFSAGRGPKSAVIVVTEGLLERLDDAELAAVVAHELAHVANRDAFVMTVAAAPTMLGRTLIWGVVSAPFTAPTPNGKLGAALAVLCLSPLLFAAWVVYALATLLVMTLSRYREYVADRMAALVTGSPETLMSALQKIGGAVSLIPQRDLRATVAMKALFVVSPHTRSSGLELDPLRLFPTHPPLERRLERLGALARELGRAGLANPLPGAKPAPDVPRAPRPANVHAAGAFVLACVFWAVTGATVSVARDVSIDGLLVAALVGLGVLAAGVVLGLQGVGRASSGAAGMGFAVAGLTLLLGPWALGFLALVVVSAAAALGLSPL